MRAMQILLMFAVVVATAAFPVRAEQSQDFGDYVVHYNALATDMLAPDVAKAYGITRSKNRAMLNLTVLRKVMGTTGEPVRAQVSASTSNLSGQMRQIEVREIREGNAIYYIGEFGITDQEVLDFEAVVKPENVDRSYQVRFRQQFFTR